VQGAGLNHRQYNAPRKTVDRNATAARHQIVTTISTSVLMVHADG
jgi:hypothetical protein